MGKGDSIILEHYKKVAKNFGLSPVSSMKDQYIRNEEVEFFITALRQLFEDQQSFSILDLGCGNGHLLEVLAKEFPQANLTGLEFHPELFELAHSRNLPKTKVIHGDMRINLTTHGVFDVIITERSVINLLDKSEQKMAFHNIVNALNPGGFYLMSESFEAPKVNLNRARAEMSLPKDVAPSRHNLWLEERDLEILSQLGLKEITEEKIKNTLSTHFYITRVLHPSIMPDSGRSGAGEFQNFFHEALPKGVGNYSPILFRVFSKPK